MKKDGLTNVAGLLLVVGGLNWGLVGLMDYNVVDMLGAGVAKVVYILVGLSALYMAWGMWGAKK